jgi:HlyD family type I secretion membrane fusion protein
MAPQPSDGTSEGGASGGGRPPGGTPPRGPGDGPSGGNPGEPAAFASVPARYAEFLPEAQSISAREHSPYARWLIVIVSLLVFALVAWAALAEVEKVAIAQGRVRPDGRVKIINHAEGGRVQNIFVEEGERVTAGQKLIEFDPEILDEELATLTNEWRNAQIETARLEAEAKGLAEPQFSAEAKRDAPLLVANQLQLFTARRNALKSRRDAADDVIQRLDREASALARSIETLEKSVEIRREQENSVRSLVDKGFYSNLRYLTLRQELTQAEGDLAESQDRLLAKFAELENAREDRRQVDDDYEAEVYGQLSEARRILERATRDLAQAQTQTQKRNLLVAAPVDGIVQDIQVTSVGQSVSANEALMRVVPTGDTLIVEARLPNQDIGFVKTGQPVEVRVDTYDFVTFGTLPGTVEHIAADATEDPESQTRVFNYIVLIRTERNHLGPTPQDQPVVPGMRVTADIKIGTRTILSFITDRVVATTETALRER